MSAADDLIDAASTLTHATRPRPTVRAAAVAAVRRGLRMAFWRPSLPDMPAMRGNGAPITRAMGPAANGLSRATPTNTSAAPRPTREMPLPNSPKSIAAAPRPRTTAPTSDRRRNEPPCSTPVPRRAAIGAILDALRAGEMEDRTVTPTPTRSEAMMVRGATTAPEAGRSIPKALSRLWSPMATRMPRPSPTSDAKRPTMNASAITDNRTCRRLAPRARSRASSRVRWATRIEKVLRMMNPPTNSEIPAKTRSAVLKNPSACCTESALSSATCWLVTTSTPAGTAPFTRSRSSIDETPSTALASTLSKRPTLPNTRWAVVSSKMARVAPARLSASPKPVMPTTVNSSVGPRNSTLTLSPRAKS